MGVCSAARPCLPVVLLLCAGCGVADYEARMLSAQARVKRWDEENRLLDAPVQVPVRSDKTPAGALSPVHFRPPLGIDPTPVNPTDPRNRLFFTWQPRKNPPPTAFARVELAFSDLNKDFPAEVLASFSGAREKPVAKQRQVEALDRETLSFVTYDFDDGTWFYSVNFWGGKRSQAAIVFQAPVKQLPAVARTIEVSLATFAAEEQAAAVRDPLKSVRGAR